jgi:hypothetical protein
MTGKALKTHVCGKVHALGPSHGKGRQFLEGEKIVEDDGSQCSHCTHGDHRQSPSNRSQEHECHASMCRRGSTPRERADRSALHQYSPGAGTCGGKT